MGHYESLKKIMPLDFGAVSDADMSAEGALLDAAENVINISSREYISATASHTLSLWELEYGIVPPDGASVAARRRAILARIRSSGGLSKQDLIYAAATLGYDVDIIEAGATIQPFRADISRAGDAVYEMSSIWQVTVKSLEGNFTDDFINEFAKLMPPHVSIIFED